MTNFKKVLEALQNMEWTETGPLEESELGTLWFYLVEKENDRISSLYVSITPPQIVEEVDENFNFIDKILPGRYRINHGQNILYSGRILYKNNLETEQDYNDFMSYVTYHYNHVTGF